MVLVVDDAELTRGDTMDGGLGVNDKGIGRCLFQRTGEVFGGVTDFKCNVPLRQAQGPWRARQAQPLGRLGDRGERDRLGDRDWLVSLSNHSNR